MTEKEKLEKALQLNGNNNIKDLEHFMNSLTTEEYTLFINQIKEIENLIASIKKFTPLEDELQNILIHKERGE